MLFNICPFRKNALDKIEILRKHKIFIDKKIIENSVANPDNIKSGYKGRFIAQKILDKDHIIRVVYVEDDESLRIITMYPGRRKRYEKN